MVTEAFSGARAPITFIGDHISGLFPNCHVVPRTAFNLVALGPLLDHRGPDYAIVLTATSALELAHVNFNTVANAPNPRVNLLQQLLSTDADGNHKVVIRTIGTRAGPGSLYNTNILNVPSPPDVRTKLVNSARTGLPLNRLNLPNLLKKHAIAPRGAVPKSLPAVPTQAPKVGTPSHASGWTSSTTTEKALIELRHIHCSLGHPSDEVLLQALNDSPSVHHHQLRKYVKLMDKCNVCPMGSQRADPRPDTATTRAADFLARLILDCSGKQPVATIGGHWFFLLISDDATRMKWIRLLKSVSQVSAVFDDFLRTVVRQGMPGARG